MTKIRRPQTSRLPSIAVPESAGFNPHRLTVARKRKGKTKSQLANAVGVDLRTISAFEAGEYQPSVETLGRISTVLGFPPAFFDGSDIEEPDAGSVSFRAFTRMRAAQRDMALSQGALAMHLNDWLEERFDLPAVALPDLSHEANPEAAAVTLRAFWGLGELSIRNMIHLLEAKGVRVFSLAIDAREVNAFSMWKDATPFVFLNTYKTAESSRFDAAHELGHLTMHKDSAPQGPQAEREANAFAAAFLMPQSSILANAPRYPSFEDLRRTKKRWNVSVAALAHRLHEVGMLTDWQYRTLCIEIAEYGRDKEPDECARETSQLLPAVFSVLYQDGITRTDVSRHLAISVEELEQLMFGLTMTSIKGGGSLQPSGADKRARLRLVGKGSA